MTEAGWTRNEVTAECIRDTLREQGNVLSPHVVAQCIDDLLKTDSYQQGRVAGLRDCKHGLDIALDEGPLKAALYRWIDARAERLEREAQPAQDEKGVGDVLK